MRHLRKRGQGLVMVALCGLVLAGCKDLKIHSAQKEIRFGESVKMWLTYKKKKRSLPSSASVIWVSDRDGRIGEGAEVELSGLSAGKHEIKVTGRYKDKKIESKTFKLKVENDAPRPVINDTPITAGVGDDVTLTGSATDREDGDVPATALSWSWKTSLGTGASATLERLKPGTHKITLSATDLAGATGTTHTYVTVVNQPPKATIATSDASIKVGESIRLRGKGVDPDPLNGMAEVADEHLTWSSDLDGELDTGSSIRVSDLSGGTHTITLEAKDEFGATGTASIQVKVRNRAPRASISEPNNGSYASVSDTIRFSASVSDPDGFAIEEQQVVWTSNRHDKPIGTGKSFLTDELAGGEHRIKVTVTDKHGASTTSKAITVYLTNEKPVARIRTSGQAIKFGETLTVEGGARDKEDGRVSPSGLVWSVLRQGETSRRKLGKGRSQKVSGLPMGTHRVFLVATDSDGESSDEVSIELTVQNNRPSVEIRAPGQDAEFLEGDAITLSGSGFDPDRQTFLSDANLTWFATRVGTVKRTLERGKEITVSDLAPGRYVITLVAADPDDAALTAKARIRIRVKPRPAIQPVPTTTSGDSGGAIGGLNNTGN